jgi:prophage DNA circulation protein
MNTDRLPNASYKGFSNLVWINDTLTQGYKKVLHEYPNRNRGFIENLGLSMLRGSVTFRVYNTLDNNNIDTFDTILRSNGAGNLVSPISGTIPDMEVLTWTKRSADNILGHVEYTVEFAQTSPNQYPIQTDSNTGFIDRKKDELFDINATALVNVWNSVQNKATQTQAALQKVRDTGNTLINVAKQVESASGVLNDFTNTVNVLINDTARLIQSPQVLADQINLAFGALEDAVDNASNLFDIVSGYFSFSSGDSNAIGTGGIQTEIQENQDAINNLISINALAIGYVVATTIEYNTFDDLNIVREKLNDEFNKIPADIDVDVLSTIQEIQVNADRVLDVQALQLPRVETQTVNQQPLGILVYSLYGSLDSYNDIYNLNNIRDAAAVSGQVLTLSNI